MSELWFFMRPETLFACVKDVNRGLGMTIVFRRHESESREADLRVIDPVDDLESAYISGGYSEVDLTLRERPAHSSDWNFPSIEEEALVLSGGRLIGRDLEMWTLRKVAKRSKMTPVFTALRRKITSCCEHGVRIAGEPRRYNEIYWERELARLGCHLRLELGDERQVTLEP